MHTAEICYTSLKLCPIYDDFKAIFQKKTSQIAPEARECLYENFAFIFEKKLFNMLKLALNP